MTPKPKILVTGGAGYIGSHMVKRLALEGYSVVTLDNLSTGYADAVRYGEFVRGDTGDAALLDKLFQQHGFAAVMHFAAFSLVGESVADPAKYFQNNVCNAKNLLDAMNRHGVRRFIFSSTAAIFGEPDYSPIDESHPARPINPYGRSKLMVEGLLDDYSRAYGLRSVSLRYFNAAGADPDGELGERHAPETHLIPLVLQAASGRRDRISVYGTDYETGDGTCVRDYIHVWDLCEAHLLALEWLLAGGAMRVFNLGNGQGYSVREVIEVVKRVTGVDIRVEEAARRAGDPAVLVADAALAERELGWRRRFPALDQIVQHAWAWETSHVR
ncbi:MAG: UDP-glucose 4-epimerase GalE [Gammaproteobacteria bacterium RIFOXYA12_FULL_61_12]|nr:MAG: UDP-glucose 4-epimerase GalE [Gammaproteobacteria bacterium RIFOXYD12_FULL_61_37]OGT92788.1 MAG: UDP-glucose 4-epimerase GalE [Gammaproteobacteria bacterium RIFOXYA12_FULL_61_12]